MVRRVKLSQQGTQAEQEKIQLIMRKMADVNSIEFIGQLEEIAKGAGEMMDTLRVRQHETWGNNRQRMGR